MKYSQLLSLIEATGLSAEQLAPMLGVSNMTIRRWSKHDPNEEVPSAYESLIAKGVQKLVIDGNLSVHNPVAAELLKDSSSNSIQAALKGMGVSESDLTSDGSHQDRMLRFLQCIGLSEQNRTGVDKGEQKINSFKKMGREWTRVITVLTGVLKSKNLTQIEKLVAYGALFYLLCPLDLIPDQIPVFGLADDFGVLTLAAGFYLSRMQKKQLSD